MNTTTHKPGSFPISYAVVAIAIAGIVLVVAAISQWPETQNQPESVAPAQVLTTVAAPQVSPNGLNYAFSQGKFDAGLVPVESPTAPMTNSDPEIVVIAGQGSLHDALIAGKFSLETDSVQYVQGDETAASGSSTALGEGTFELATNPTESSGSVAPETATETVRISGQGGLYAALAAGKFTTDFEPNVRYVLRSNTGSGLWEAHKAGQLPEGIEMTESSAGSSAADHAETPSGGHQE